MRVLGIDPGTAVTGFGLVEAAGSLYDAIDFGCIRPPAKLPISKKRLIIYEGICHLLERYRPDALSIETQYVQKNARSALMIGMVRGIAILAATQHGIPSFEYSPSRAKKAVSGSGRATKDFIQLMMQKLLQLTHPPTPEDAADALALAICHLHATKSRMTTPEI